MGAVRAVRLGFGVAVAMPALAAGSAGAAPVGQVSEFSSGLGAGSGVTLPGITGGPDGNVWFTDRDCISTGTCAIGRITPRLAISGRSGANAFTLAGLPGHRALGTGAYRVTLLPAAAGLTGAPASIGFRISG